MSIETAGSATSTLDRSGPGALADERLAALGRDDKWSLSCGDGAIWAPRFPLWLDRPGFWDEAVVHHCAFAPLFSVALVGPQGREIALEHVRRRWRPDALTVEWRAAGGPVFVEERSAQPGGRFVSAWHRTDRDSWTSTDLQGAHLVAFSAQPAESVRSVGRPVGASALSWQRTLVDRHDIPLDVWATLGVDTSLHAWSIRIAALRAEGGPDYPAWTLTPFADAWLTGSGVREGVKITDSSDSGILFMAVDVPLDAVRESRVAFSLALKADLPNPTPHPAPRTQAATPSWGAFLDSFPRFTCSNPFLSRYYDYRLYGLRLLRLAGDSGHIRYPAIAAGIGHLHTPTAYSAQCHMWETRWGHSPELAQGSLLNFLAHQQGDGALRGGIHANHLLHTDFCHANWGDAVLAVDAVHEDDGFLKQAYDGLERYARWLDQARDPEASGMYDIVRPSETGQDHMSRYRPSDSNADGERWQSTMRLKGVDVTVYAYQLKRALAIIADRLALDASDGWRIGAERTGRAIMEVMWDESLGLFSDVEPRTMRRTRVKAAVCFYPMLTDLLDESITRRLLEHLENRDTFATPYPVPSSSRDDPMFSASGEWRGTRRDCPWNGRVWPITNSHVLEGLIRQWRFGRREVGRYAVRLLTRFISMMFHDRDHTRPNCYEHYNPLTGHPSVHRGIDDHQQSWINDLLIRGAAGLDPMTTGIAIDPLPLPLDDVAVTGASIRGHRVDLVRSGSAIEVTVDGATYSAEVGTPLVVPFG